MDIRESRVALRARGVFEVVDLSLRFLAIHHRVYARLAAVTLLPFVIGTAACFELVGVVPGYLVMLVGGKLLEAPFLVLGSRLVFADDTTVAETLRETWASSARMLGVRLRALLYVTLGLLVVVPAIMGIFRWMFATEVAVLERASGRALLRSTTLFSSHGDELALAVFLLLFGDIAAPLLADVALSTVLVDLLQVKAPAALWEFSRHPPLGLVGYAVYVPLRATIRFFLYLDVRTRSEGWDIQTRFASLAARTQAAVVGGAS